MQMHAYVDFLNFLFILMLLHTCLYFQTANLKCQFNLTFGMEKVCFSPLLQIKQVVLAFELKKVFISYLYHQMPHSCDNNIVVSFPSSQYSNYVVVLIFYIMSFFFLGSGQDVVGSAVSVSSLHPQT